MRVKTVSLDEQTRAVLLASRIEGKNLWLPGQLPRDQYVKVAKAIEAAGGKWNRKAGCHVFPDDVRDTLNIGTDTVEVVNVQQTFQAFNTPFDIAAWMCKEADLTAGDKVLEPSAGTGQLIRAAMAFGIFQSDIVAVEIDPKKAAALKCRTICADFLTCDERIGKFDRVLMNPPFTSCQDVSHIKHALKFLEDGGRLVALCANGPKQREALEPLCSKWTDLPAGSFKEAGTNVNVAMVVIDA